MLALGYTTVTATNGLANTLIFESLKLSGAWFRGSPPRLNTISKNSRMPERSRGCGRASALLDMIFDLTLKAHLPFTGSRKADPRFEPRVAGTHRSRAIIRIPTLRYGIFSHCRPAYGASPTKENWLLQLFPFLGDAVLQVSFALVTSLVLFVGVGIDSIHSRGYDEGSRCRPRFLILAVLYPFCPGSSSLYRAIREPRGKPLLVNFFLKGPLLVNPRSSMRRSTGQRRKDCSFFFHMHFDHLYFKTSIQPISRKSFCILYKVLWLNLKRSLGANINCVQVAWQRGQAGKNKVKMIVSNVNICLRNHFHHRCHLQGQEMTFFIERRSLVLCNLVFPRYSTLNAS